MYQMANFNRYNLAEYFGQGALRACLFGKVVAAPTRLSTRPRCLRHDGGYGGLDLRLLP